jgi:perosamine synthetase
MKINFSNSNIPKNDIKVVSEILKSGWLTHGKYTKQFEDLFASYTKSKFAITLSSCTAALHLSCLASGFKRGDEIIVPAQTHTATSHAVEYVGAKPIFIDIKDKRGLINTDQIIKKINKNTKGIIVVHTAGLSCDMKKIKKICFEYNLKLIEDCAHALGTRFNSKHVGNFGLTGCFSFYPTKQITTGEGGMLITNSKKIYNKIKELKAFGIDKDINNRTRAGHYDVKDLGYNFRMTDFQAALGLAQLKRYDLNLKIRRKNAYLYSKFFKNIKGVTFPNYDPYASYFIFQVFVKNKRNNLMDRLKEMNIGHSIHYAIPVPMMSYYKKKYNLKKKDYNNAILYGKENISLPTHPGINKNKIKLIVSLFKKYL